MAGKGLMAAMWKVHGAIMCCHGKHAVLLLHNILSLGPCSIAIA